MLETYEQNSKKKLIATALAVLVIAGVVMFADHLKTTNSTTTNTVAQTTSPTTAATTGDVTTPTTSDTSASTSTSSSTATSTTSPSTYKDGTYTATSEYYVPHGDESIEVSLTVSSSVVTSVSIQNSESDRDSASYQEEFASAYKSYVVGKKISGLKISTIAGASDTTQGFNDALSQIASKAQA